MKTHLFDWEEKCKDKKELWYKLTHMPLLKTITSNSKKNSDRVN